MDHKLFLGDALKKSRAQISNDQYKVRRQSWKVHSLFKPAGSHKKKKADFESKNKHFFFSDLLSLGVMEKG